jgi:hypothetical protein
MRRLKIGYVLQYSSIVTSSVKSGLNCELSALSHAFLVEQKVHGVNIANSLASF